MNILEVFEKLVVEYKLLLNVEKSLFALPQVAWLLFIDEVGKLIGFWCQVSSGCWTPKLLKSVDFFQLFKKNNKGAVFFWKTLYIIIIIILLSRMHMTVSSLQLTTVLGLFLTQLQSLTITNFVCIFWHQVTCFTWRLAVSNT